VLFFDEASSAMDYVRLTEVQGREPCSSDYQSETFAFEQRLSRHTDFRPGCLAADVL
jgi:hypothetical protein